MRATLLVCTVHFVQCFVCSARHMHKPHHAQANPCTCNSQEGMHCIVLVAVCFWALFTLCTSYVVYSSQCAMLRVLGVHCANVVRFAVCRMFQCPVCFEHKLCSVHPDSVQRACSKQGVHCSVCSVCIVQMSCAFCCVQGVSVHRLPCAQAVYSTPPSLCNVCVPCRVCNARCAQCEQSPSQVQIAAQRLRPLPPAFILCSVCAVNIVCTIPTSDGARRGSQVPPFSSKVCGNRVNSVLLT